MPDITITVGDAGVVAVAQAVQAVCHLAEVVIEAQPDEQRAAIAKLQIEQLKPWTALAERINALLGV
jgi:hypothetical protein